MFIDSHCHINFPELAEKLDEVLENMRRNEVSDALCVGVSLDKLPQILALAEKYPHVYASVGVHPDHELDAEPSVDQLVQLAAHPKVVAIGETGLDYFRLKGDLEWQRERFRTHIRAARRCGKPLIIHTRDAAADTLRIMQEEGAEQVGGVMHCFTESLETAQAAMALGFYISFSGIVTFKSAAALKEVDGVTYVNCGDWVDSCTAVVEHVDGRLEIVGRAAPAALGQPERSPDGGRDEMREAARARIVLRRWRRCHGRNVKTRAAGFGKMRLSQKCRVTRPSSRAIK